jgi:hypothetical protein
MVAGITTKRALLLVLTITAAAAAAAATTDNDGDGGRMRRLHDRPTTTTDNNNNSHRRRRRGGGLRQGGTLNQHKSYPLHEEEEKEEYDDSNNNDRRRRRLPQATVTTTNGDDNADTTTENGGGGGGAFNPNLVTYDPNSSEYQFNHQSTSTTDNLDTGSEIPPPESWSPCPINNLNFSGHRASYDCSSYIECSGGQPHGEYMSCMGLKFDNEQGVCDWAENVICDSSSNTDDEDVAIANDESDEENDEGEEKEGEIGNNNNNNNSEEGIIGSITDYDIDMTNSAGSNGAEANTEVTGWSGGSDWGGSWIDGVWYVV